MRKPRVYLGAALASGKLVDLDRVQGHYLKNVLRLKPGAAFFLFDGRSALDYEATLIADGKKLSAEIGAARALATESGIDSQVMLGLGRSDQVDWSIQKTTELGVNRISVFNAERTQSPLKPAQVEKKLAHWRGVAISACEQCGRAILPEIEFHAGPDEALGATDADTKILLDFDGPALASVLDSSPPSIAILLGPEGGLNTDEIESARNSGFQPASLGNRVLRFETAATAALAIVQAFGSS